MRSWSLFLIPCIVIFQLGFFNASGKILGKQQRKHIHPSNHSPLVVPATASKAKASKKLVDGTNASAICGLPMQTNGNRKHVVAGKKFQVTAKLTNNVNMVFEEIVVQFSLPRGASYDKGTVFPRLDYGNTPALENQGTLVVWRHVHMKPKQSRYFKVMVMIACNSTTPLTFRSYTTVGGVGWITGPDVEADVVSSRSHKQTCNAFPPVPINVTEYVPNLSDASNPPSGVWTSGRGSLLSTQNITQLPSSRRWLSMQGEGRGRSLVANGYPTALRQETSIANISIATAGVYFDPYGICDGLLFKHFVLDGFQFYYQFWVDSTPAGYENVYAPNLVLQTRSPATGQVSSFSWNPAVNGDTYYQTWVTSFMNQGSGSSAPWPVGPSGGSGWGCTAGCYLPPNTTVNQEPTYRSLDTYVEELLSFPTCSSANCALTDAVITGIQVVLGPYEPSTVAFTRKVGFTAGTCSYEWIFGAP